MWVGDKLIEKAETYVEKKIEENDSNFVSDSKNDFQSDQNDSDETPASQKEQWNDQLTETDQIKNVLHETKTNLENLKNSVVLPADQEKTKEYIQWLLASIKTLDVYDKTLISEIEKTIADQNYDNKKAIEQMIAVIADLEKKSEQLSQADKDKLLDQNAGINSSNLLLGELRQTISLDPEKAIKEAKEQAFTELTNELKKKWRCPNSLADKLHTLLVDKYINKKEQNIWQKILSWLAVGILSLTMGKYRKDFFINIDNLSFDHIKNILWSVADKRKSVRESIKTGTIVQDIKQKKDEVVQEAKELTEDEKKKWEEWLKKLITRTVQNINGKIPTKEQIDRVFKKINVAANTENIQKIYRYIATNGVEGWEGNIIEWLFELISLPFSFSRQIIEALREESLISVKDIVFEVWDGVVWYGLKWFKLFGAWVSAIFWKITWKEMWEELGAIYDKTPDQAKVVLAALVYKTQQNPFFKVMLNMAEQATYILTTALVDWWGKVRNVAKNLADVYNKNISTAMWNMEDLLRNLEKLWGTTDVIAQMKNSTSQMLNIGKLVDLEIPKNLTGAWFEEFLTHKWLKLADFPSWIQELKSVKGVIDQTKLHKKIATEVPWICGTATVVKWQRWFFKTLKTDVKWFFQGEANPFRMGDEAAKYLDETGKLYGDVLGGGKLRSSIAKLQLSRKLVSWIHDAEKATFYAKDVQTAEDMIKQMKFLAKEAPSTLKFLIGKTPLFLVWWMALAQDGTPTEKMKNLLQDMKWLIPIVWPIMIMHDAGTMQKIDIAQMTVWTILLVADWYYIVKAWARAGRAWVMKYLTQPIVDVYEIGKFGLDGFKRWWTLLKNTVSLAEKEWFWSWLKWVWKALFTKARLGKTALALWCITAGYLTIDYFFWNDVDDDTKAKLAEYEKDPNKLDTEVLAQWPTLDQEERNDYLKAALIARGWFSAESLGDLDVKYDATKKRYLVQLPEVLNGDQKDLLKETLTNALSDLQPDASVSMQLAPRAIVEYRNKLNELYKDKLEPDKTRLKKEYIQTMWYDADAILSA